MFLLSNFYREFSVTIRIGRNSLLLGSKYAFSDFSSKVPRQERVNLAAFELGSSSSQSLNVFPFYAKTQPNVSVTGAPGTSSNDLRGSTFLQSKFSHRFVDPNEQEFYFDESSTAQNAGMSIEFILNRYAAGQALPVQNRSLRADSDTLTDAEMKRVSVISSTLEAEAYIREVNAAKAAADELAKASASAADELPNASASASDSAATAAE